MIKQIIGIDNFLKVKIVKMNDKYSLYTVDYWNGKYFKKVEWDFIELLNENYTFDYALNTELVIGIKNTDIHNIENAINKLYKELTNPKITIIINTNNSFIHKDQVRTFAERVQDYWINCFENKSKK